MTNQGMIRMSQFDPAVAYILQQEGGLSENPYDHGGITNFGISLRFLQSIPLDRLKSYGIFTVDNDTIRNLTLDQVKELYRGEFWNHARFSDIQNQVHANYIFDMAINMGLAPAIKCAQRACWAIMNRWEELPDDGILGDKTLAILKQCGFLLMPALRAERANYYRQLVTQDATRKEFLRGWYDRTYRN
jgi:lysozyme family protein